MLEKIPYNSKTHTGVTHVDCKAIHLAIQQGEKLSIDPAGKIIEWTLSETLEAVHVAETVRKAMKKRKITAPLVLHSDRGSQYVSDAYRQAAAELQLSYSKKGYPYDNACIESFHSLIKREWLKP